MPGLARVAPWLGMERSATELPAPAETLTRSLARWYRGERRRLPWRESGDPYAIWISEVMLQQTTVATVIPYWERFLERFPDVHALADAPLEEVLRVWSGLGYYRRARQLHRAARQVASELGGVLPRSAERLRELPGIGPYTAAAIASIAFREPVPAVDGNVVRVVARLCAIDGETKRRATMRRIESAAAELVDPQHPGDHNQALMELGATVCSARDPSCARCPWRESCRARDQGRVELLPTTSPRRATVRLLRAAAAIGDGRGRFLLRRVPEGEHNEGLFDLPTVELPWERNASTAGGGSAVPAPPETIAALFERQLGLRLRLGLELGHFDHAVTHHRIRVWVYRAVPEPPLVTPGEVELEGAAWGSIDGEAPLAASGRKALRLASAGSGDAPPSSPPEAGRGGRRVRSAPRA